ncbi:uncharacterized protein L201_006709 [Kwoniella dendrophila CBS 6074]|uniref:F-box domain-containing protein n=1 Tax=Kwoniella dendrophila CBS 6074 TaxID=1295534 RepID=A0AAX4K2J9_9TREE
MLWSVGIKTTLQVINQNWVKTNGQRNLPLKSLMIKYTTGDSQLDILQTIAKICPTLEEVYICSDGASDDGGINPELTWFLPTSQKGDFEKDSKLMDMWREDLMGYDRKYENNTSVDRLFDTLNKFKNLKVYEGQLEVILPPKVEVLDIYSRYKSEYQQERQTHQHDILRRPARLFNGMEERFRHPNSIVWTSLQNFKGDIKARNARDLSSFRLTCKRIHEICKLKNIHLYLVDLREMRKWLHTAPIEAENSINRLRIHLPGNDSSGVVNWSAFTTLLSNLPNLVELIISRSVFCRDTYSCRYSPEGQQFKAFKLPRYSILPNLRSLAITVTCNYCASENPLSILPATTKLEHLKIRLVSPEELEKDDDVDYTPSKAFKEIIDIWCENNIHNERRNQLKSLYLQYLPFKSDRLKLGWRDTIKEIFKSLPMLEDLRTTQYNPNVQYLHYGMKIMAEKSGNVWNFKVKKFKDVDAEGHEDQSVEEVLTEIGTCGTLKYLDLIILVETGSIGLLNPVATCDETLRSFLKGRPDSDFPQTEYKETNDHADEIDEALIALIEIFRNHFPSLEKGSFWEHGTENDPRAWSKWNWKLKFNQETGKIQPVIEEFPWILPKEFVACREGLRSPRLSDGRELSDNSDTDPDSDED